MIWILIFSLNNPLKIVEDEDVNEKVFGVDEFGDNFVEFYEMKS